jgi:hypothetical protein
MLMSEDKISNSGSTDRLSFFLTSRHYEFYPAVYFAPGQHDSVATGEAFQTDIRSQAGNPPFIASTGVSFSQSHNITQSQLLEHAGIISSGIYNPSWSGIDAQPDY